MSASRTLTPIALAVCIHCGPFVAVQAQEAATPAPAASSPDVPTTTLPAVRVKAGAETEDPTGPVHGYKARRATTATKTDTPLRHTPMSVSVLTRDLIVDQGATNVQDALNYAAGVRPDAYGLDSRTDSIRVRGGYPDEYLDGLRKNFDYYTSNARTEPYTLERIELLRGPAAMLYGQGTVGGVVNLVSKRPQAEAQGEIGLQLGRWNRRQLQADVTGPLTEGGEWLYRLIAVGREADTQVDHVRDDRRLFAPSLTWKPSPATSLTLQALTQSDRSGSTAQFFPWAGTVAPNPNGQLPTNRFIGDPEWDRYDTDRNFIGYLLEHKASDTLTLRQNLRYTHTDVDYRSVYGDAFTVPGGWAADPVNQRVLGRIAWATLTDTKLLTLDQNLLAKFGTGPVEHELLVGLDVARYSKHGSTAYGSGGTIDAYAPDYSGYTPPPYSDDAPFVLRQVGLYAQDQLRFARHWLLTVGLRHDRARNETVEGLSSGADDVQHHRATTRRVGLLYASPSGLSPYVSYSESFTPLANIGSQRFKPLRGEQWEAGVKYAPEGGPVSVNVAAYEVREVNQLGAQDPLTMLYPQLGQTKASGVEVDVTAAIARSLDLTANYTYTELDEQLEQMPRHQTALWGKWNLATLGARGLSLGAGVRHLAAYRDGAAPTVPSLTLFDAMLAWENAHWRAALNIANLADKTYVASCGARGDCWYGARRNIVGTVSYRW